MAKKMVAMKYIILALVVLLLLCAILCAPSAFAINRTTVSQLDLNRFMGRWYEIARFDHRFERDLDECAAFYKLMPEGKISVENTGINATTGKRKTSYGKAHAGNKAGLLRVSFFWFFYSDYKILALDENYQWALIGSSSPDYLWILARTPQLPQATLDAIVSIAKKRGYDTEKLIWVKQ